MKNDLTDNKEAMLGDEGFLNGLEKPPPQPELAERSPPPHPELVEEMKWSVSNVLMLFISLFNQFPGSIQSVP